MTVKELYQILDQRYPVALREEWDHDGLMLAGDPEAPVRRVLCSLDATEAAVEKAVLGGYDLLVTHHPLLFHPLTALTPDIPVARKCMKLLHAGVSVFSFHTRLDTVPGGVNDVLAERLALQEVTTFGSDSHGMGRIGRLPKEMPLPEFAKYVKNCLHSDFCFYAGNRPVYRVAVLGGDGKDFVKAAKEAGADTYLTGCIGYNRMTEAAESFLNLCEAGHFFTEDPVTGKLQRDILKADPTLTVDRFCSNNIALV